MTLSSCLRPRYRADNKSRSKEKAKGMEYNEAKRKDNSTLPNQELMTFGDTSSRKTARSKYMPFSTSSSLMIRLESSSRRQQPLIQLSACSWKSFVAVGLITNLSVLFLSSRSGQSATNCLKLMVSYSMEAAWWFQ